MAQDILIVGDSGTGKSTSIRNLPPKETFLINVINKPLPFKGWKKNYSKFSKDNPEGNYVVTDNFNTIIQVLDYIDKNRPEIKYIVIDDFQYIMANELMRRAKEKGYDRFLDIAHHAWLVTEKIKQLRDDLTVFVLSHAEVAFDENGNKYKKAKTIGKMLDEKITIEGLFTIVLFTEVRVEEDGTTNYVFLTKNDGSNTCKSPMGLFDEGYIENDLMKVVKLMKEYYEEA
jgi:hypothetical protein